MPLVVNLRVDPFEHGIDASAEPLYAGRMQWALRPAATVAGTTTKEWPCPIWKACSKPAAWMCVLCSEQALQLRAKGDLEATLARE